MGQPLHLSEGQVLFGLGSEADRIFIVKRGRIVLTLPLRIQGEDRETFVEEKQPDEAVGWSALVPPHRFTLKAVASVESDVTAYARDQLEALFDRQPAVGRIVMSNLSAVIGGRLMASQAMWLREIQRWVDHQYP